MSSTATSAPEGLRTYFVDSSFHRFVVEPLQDLAREAGMQGHAAVTWNPLAGKITDRKRRSNAAGGVIEHALASGCVQVLTLCTDMRTAESAIEEFASLVVKHAPHTRILLQHTWGDSLTSKILEERRRAHGSGGPITHGQIRKLVQNMGHNRDRDSVSMALLEAARLSGNQVQLWRTRLLELNRRHGIRAGFLVPANDAVLRAREAIVRDRLPGVARQSELFRDVIGHASQVTMDLICYLWFGALYRRNPAGLRALIQTSDASAPARHRELQRIAWDALVAEPMSGVSLH